MIPDHTELDSQRLLSLSQSIKQWGKSLGFQQVGITDVKLDKHEHHLQQWLEKKFHGQMSYMENHGIKRSRPELLVPGTIRVISVSMEYFPASAKSIREILKNQCKAYVSRYALGRDYHKVMRQRLKRLANKIESASGPSDFRVFVDSAPVLEKALAQKSGLGWIGKHTNSINRHSGSWFFLGEIYTNIPLPIDEPASNHCGTCTACIDICPTQAIIGPYQLDARRCISYLTIELKGSIPLELRPLIGNRIYGCDDCQLVCPWNRYARYTEEEDFSPRYKLDNSSLIELFAWSEVDFMKYTAGSAIRRITYESWQRNIAIALGNALRDNSHNQHAAIINTLRLNRPNTSELVKEHIDWALKQHKKIEFA